MPRGDPLQNSRSWPFFGRTLLGRKIANARRILALLMWMDVEFIPVSIDTRLKFLI